MLPISTISKIGVYDIDMNGVIVKARVADYLAVVDIGIEELKSQLSNMEQRIVGFDLKGEEIPNLLLLQAGCRCLIIQLNYLCQFPESLNKLFADRTLCFVGVRAREKFEKLFSFFRKWSDLKLSDRDDRRILEADELAARVLKKPILMKSSVMEIAWDVGVLEDVNGGADSGYISLSACPDWSATVFSTDEVKHAILEAYMANEIVKELLY